MPLQTPEAPAVGCLPAVPEPRGRGDGLRRGRPAVPRPRRRRELQRAGLRPAWRHGPEPRRPVHPREPVWRPGHRHVTRPAPRRWWTSRAPRVARSAARTSGRRATRPGWAVRSCGSIPPPAPPRRAIRSPPALTRTRSGSSRPGSATRSGSRSARGRRSCTSATSATTPGRRSTGSRSRHPGRRRRSPTRAGRATRGPVGAGLLDAGHDVVRRTSTPRGRPAGRRRFYSYSHKASLSPTGPCFAPNASGTDGAAPTGLAFYQGPSGAAISYPAKYAQRAVLRRLRPRLPRRSSRPAGGGAPSAAGIEVVASGIGNPVDLTRAPNGDLVYVDHDGGLVVGIRYLVAPIARATATPSHALAPVTVHLDGSTSTDPDPSSTITSYQWDLDDDGAYDDASGVTYNWPVTTPGVYDVGLRVTSSNGLSDSTIDHGRRHERPAGARSSTRPRASLTWAVGDSISVSGHATDAGRRCPQRVEARLGPRAASTAPSDCHEHFVEEATGTDSDLHGARPRVSREDRDPVDGDRLRWRERDDQRRAPAEDQVRRRDLVAIRDPDRCRGLPRSSTPGSTRRSSRTARSPSPRR